MLTLFHTNVRAVKSKTACLLENTSSTDRGGGAGLLFKKAIDVKKIAAGEKLSSEFSE